MFFASRPWAGAALLGVGLAVICRKSLQRVVSRFLYKVFTSSVVSRYVLKKTIAASPHAHTSTRLVAVNSHCEVLPVAVLKDNYSYVIVERSSGEAAVVDPADAAAVQRAVDNLPSSIHVRYVLTTHHHFDHAYGNKKFKAAHVAVQVIGSRKEKVQGCSLFLEDGETLSLGALTIKAIRTPGHTQGHLCYHVTAPGDLAGAVFTGDCLFVGGCGKLFEGSPKDMETSMKSLANLPPETKVFVGHEYTVANLEFARWLEPDNERAEKALQHAQDARSSNKQTVPSTIAQEKAINPYMRTEVPAIRQKCGLLSAPSWEVLGKVRALKDKAAHIRSAKKD